MKTILFLFLVLMPSLLFGVTGELVIKFLGTTSKTFNLKVSSSDYSWRWQNEQVVRDQNFFSANYNSKSKVDYDSPKSDNSSHYLIPWGLFQFTITVSDGMFISFSWI